MIDHRRQTGFTLIEIAVVLVIVGLLVGSFINTFSSRIETTRVSETETLLEDIKQVLMSYAYSRGGPPYFPCPDITVPPDGLEDRTAGVCDAAGAVGTLPWRDIGLGLEDAWGAHYRYWVANDYSVDTGFGLNASNTAGNAVIETRLNDVNIDMASAVFVVFSHGKNGFGGTSAQGIARPAIPVAGYDDENENIDADLVFMSRPHSGPGSATAGGIYDDILIWAGPYEVKARMVSAGALPP